MTLELYPHNEAAYRAAISMLVKYGKAAVIQPTGTGKSFVAFKLAEQHPQSRIWWLGPSDHIFKTQLEGLKKAGASAPDNIRFLTYTRLMLMEGVLEEPEPDYIILDEFHRCGAAEWGRSVERMLALHLDARVLGLSATSVRYLDNQRDMAQELFDGAVAWEMSLGEAIGREILPAPVYVVAMYSVQMELEKLQKKVIDRKNAGERKINEELLERLRRMLKHAEGMDAIFARYMKPNGKYLLFCSDKEHMEELMEQIPAWFHGVDECPHIYKAYYDNPETDTEFDSFKADRSDHLKLLFCINMLNEGVHVEDVDGVVLLRPTISPTLYLQQIGRALSAGSSQKPVIFDLVNNFDSLYCVDALREEAERFYALMHENSEVCGEFSESFCIVDQVKECRALFEQLKRNLSAPWDIYYQALVEYQNSHGNIRVPKKYTTSEGLSLGSWLQTQRRVRAGNIRGNLTQEQITKLDALEMVWDDGPTYSWNRGYAELMQYREHYGNVDVKSRHVTQNGYSLGAWVSAQRQKYPDSLTEEQIRKLEALGMVWNKDPNKWDTYYQVAKSYFKEHGNLRAPWNYETPKGEALGKWLQKQRRLRHRLTKQQQTRLEAIGMEWENQYDRLWEEKYELARGYYEVHGNLDIPVKYSVNGIRLGRWISTIRSKRRHPHTAGLRLDEERIRQLEAIGMVWED